MFKKNKYFSVFKLSSDTLINAMSNSMSYFYKLLLQKKTYQYEIIIKR